MLRRHLSPVIAAGLLAQGLAAAAAPSAHPGAALEASGTVPVQSAAADTAAAMGSVQPAGAPSAPSPATTSSSGAPPNSAPLNLEIRLDLSQREIALMRDGKAVNRWPVVIGAPETPTPVGRFKVQTKVVNPVYQSTSTGQVKGVGALGYRWIGFHSKGPNVFGIHGTPWPWWVDARAAVSHGCVRMRNEHIERLFAAVEVGTPVIIQP
jgi:lipoprotein-anchoring transpeptidase ErfK/SrfK